VSPQLNLGLVRVTLTASDRQIDLALPAQVTLAEVMPTLLHYLGASLRADPDAAATGWSVRRADGTRLAYDKTFVAQQVRDGATLYLVPRDAEWPEPDYDDLALALADGSAALGPTWQGRHTRAAALVVTSTALLIGLVVLLLSGPGWSIPTIVALAAAATTLCVGTVLSRALGDSGAGAAIAAHAMPYAFLAGLLLLGGRSGLTELGAPNLLTGSMALLVAALLGFVATADQLWLFVAGMLLGLLGSLAGTVQALTSAPFAGAAAVVVCVALAVMPLTPGLSLRLAKIPMPDLPQTPQDLLKDAPLPPSADIRAGVMRTSHLFGGLLLGASVAIVACVIVLAVHGGVAALLLAGIASALCLNRARMLLLARQRTPVLAAGVLGFAFAAIGLALAVDTTVRPVVVYLGLLPAALVATATGITYSRRPPSPLFGRLADIFDAVLVVSVVPVACAVLGLYGVMRGLAG